MRDQLRTLIDMASSVTEVPRRRAEKIAKDLAKAGELTAGQISTFSEELVGRSRQNAEAVRSLVRGEIRRQIRSVGLVTRDEIERLNRRIRDLETKGLTGSGTRKRASPRKTTSTKSPRTTK